MVIPYKIAQVEACLEKLKEDWARKYECWFCEKEIISSSGRATHEKRMHVSRGERFTCTCGFECMNRSELKKHTKLKHPK